MSKVLFKMRMIGGKLRKHAEPWAGTYGELMQHLGITREDFEHCKHLTNNAYEIRAWVNLGRPNISEVTP